MGRLRVIWNWFMISPFETRAFVSDSNGTEVERGGDTWSGELWHSERLGGGVSGGGRRRRELKWVWMTNLGCSGAEVPTQVNKLKWPLPQRLYSRERERERRRLMSPKKVASVRVSTPAKPLNSVPTSHHTIISIKKYDSILQTFLSQAR
jgi:hypothetical protein